VEDRRRTEVLVSPEVERKLREIAREEIDRRLSGVREDWSLERMQAATRRIEERRKRAGAL
jgi:hypothetical protein